jgi:hypothetical protein
VLDYTAQQPRKQPHPYFQPWERQESLDSI